MNTRGRKPSGKPRSARASASLPPDIYQTLQDIARQKKVSVAWIIRDAAERYIAEQWPLFAANQGAQSDLERAHG
jgi:predicted transcriptional regulator